ncbi:putative Na(+)/H(+) antiporter GerT [Paenibacillus nuruki]|uniref:Putative Na(+)/H(+) antiporter GerT n=1 Tax=Paenibacillus nuruki TaxID=1886670 RepID=A0A1E3L6B8_9BACL|nr:cation:proton antiporter [Paenibacillus nuruki]ODP29372.1 putative Na(+)/H(+) antiporter GerT [Paenibacillus nuruki]
MEFILYLVLILLGTKIAGHVSVRLGQPSVLGELLIGIVLGPAVLGWIHQGSFIEYFAEIGVLLLMFMAGLETDLEQLKKNWKSALAVAVSGIILPLMGGFGVGEWFGFSVAHSLFLGVLLSATSVSITVQVLKEMNKLDSKEATTILGAAVVDDVLVVILLAILTSFFSGGAGGDVSIQFILIKKIIFFAVIFIVGWLVIPKVLLWMSKFRVMEPVLTVALVFCFAFAYFGETMGIAGIIGAFAAGMAISQTPFRHQVEIKIEPIAYSIFVPVFFVSIGLNVSFEGVSQQIGLLIILTIVAVVTKLFGGAIGAGLTGFDKRSSFAIGAGMVSRGEVALIIASTGLSSGLLLPEFFTTMIIIIILTTLIAPPVLKILFSRNDPALPDKYI